MYTQEEYKVASQRTRVLHSKIYILNFAMQTIAELSGNVLDGATFTNDSQSDIRRTCNITIVPTDSTFDIATNKSIWIDKYVKIYIGIEDIHNNNNIVYTNMGVYLVDNPARNYDAITHTLNISGVDMMARFTGLRNGYLEGIPYQVPQGSSIKNAMTECVKLMGIKKYSIVEPSPTSKVPNDISISVGGTVFDIMTQLRDINANYQIYFDVDGVFHYDMIPSGKNEPVLIDDKLWKNTLVSYNTSINFESVKNYIEVYGKTDDDYGVTPMGIAYDDNPESPFYYKGTAGIIRQVFTGGEYDNIQGQGEPPSDPDIGIPTWEERSKDPKWMYYDSLAQQRANYELYLNCKLQDSVSINCIPIYFLDVNWIVEITLPIKKQDGTEEEETRLYMIKSISTTLGTDATQTLSLARYYPLYPF